MRKNRTRIFVEIDEVSDNRTVQIDIAIEIIVGKPFRVVTVVTVQSLLKIFRETGKVLGRIWQPAGRTTRPLFVRIPESGRVLGRELELYLWQYFSFLECPELK